MGISIEEMLPAILEVRRCGYFSGAFLPAFFPYTLVLYLPSPAFPSPLARPHPYPALSMSVIRSSQNLILGVARTATVQTTFPSSKMISAFPEATIVLDHPPVTSPCLVTDRAPSPRPAVYGSVSQIAYFLCTVTIFLLPTVNLRHR